MSMTRRTRPAPKPHTGLAIEVTELVKTYGRGLNSVRALDGVRFAVPAGAVVGLLGPNGAGKSTTVKILTTLTAADAGSATVAGLDVARAPADVRRAIGYVPQRPSFDPTATGRENLTLQGRIHGLPGRVVKRRTTELLERFGLADASDRIAKTWSGGMQRKLDVALGLVHRPQVLFLDIQMPGLTGLELAQVLTRLADHLEQVQRQQHKARTALIYPTVLMAVSLAVVVGLMTFVVPKLTEQFAHAGQSLPLITSLLIGLSQGLVHAGPWLLGLAPLLGVVGGWLLRKPHWCLRRDQVLLRLPRIGSLLQVLESARLARSLAILSGSGVALLTSGMMLVTTVAAAATLKKHGISTAVVNVPVIKPLDGETIRTVCAAAGAAVTVENHSVIGGLGAAVAEVVAEAGLGCRLQRVGVQDTFAEGARTAGYLFDRYGLSTQAVVDAAWSALGRPDAAPRAQAVTAGEGEYAPV